MKKCTKCLQEKPIEEFYLFNKEKNQRINRCKSCHREYTRSWQVQNPHSLRKAWTKHNRKRKGRFCPHCGEFFKIGTSQIGCSTKCRLYLSFDKKENGCWQWNRGKSGRKDMAYGSFWENKIHKKSHQISYEIHKGKIPPGICVCHTCDNSLCVNPDHLFLGTHQDNMDDMNRKGRGNSGKIRFRKYSPDICHQVLELRANGMTFKQISNTLPVKESACKFICARPERLLKIPQMLTG